MGSEDFRLEAAEIEEVIIEKINALDELCKSEPMNRGLISKVSSSTLLTVTNQLLN